MLGLFGFLLMSEQPPLDSLTLKDLRKLAGEHQVPNRSTLNKQQLLGALSSTLRDRLGQQNDEAPAAEVAENKKPAPAKKPAVKAAPAKGEEVKAPVEVSEPEVLTPDSVSHLTAVADDKGADADEGPAAGENAETDNAEGNGDEPRKRKRAVAAVAVVAVTTPRVPKAQTMKKALPKPPRLKRVPTAPNQTKIAMLVTPLKKPHPPTAKQAEGLKPATTTSSPAKVAATVTTAATAKTRSVVKHPPRPRLQGQQRSLPAVLDRLRWFSSGILELCDPDTPSWGPSAPW